MLPMERAGFRLHTVLHLTHDQMMPPLQPWSSVEISVGIICACLPTMQPVLRLFSGKVHNATLQQRKRESGGLWYSESAVRETHHGNKHDREVQYETLEVELATLRSAYINSK